MNRHFVLPLFLVAALLISLSTAMAGQLPPSGAVNGEQALVMMQDLGKKLHILDVRTAGEFEQGHMPGAQLLPVQELGSRMQEVPQDGPLLIVCRTGRRAEAAYQMIRQAQPQREQMWFLRGVPEYHMDGTFSIR